MTTVREIMSTNVTVIDTESSLADAAALMAERKVGALPIVHRDGQVCGVLTDRDIVLKCLATGPDPYFTKAARCAQGPPVTIGEQDSAADAAKLMTENRIGRLLVCSGDDLVGIVCRVDVALGMKAGEFAEAMQPMFTESEEDRAGLVNVDEPAGLRPFFAHFWNRMGLLGRGERTTGSTVSS